MASDEFFSLTSSHGQSLFGWIHTPLQSGAQNSNNSHIPAILLCHGYLTYCNGTFQRSIAYSCPMVTCRFSIPQCRPDEKTFRMASFDLDVSDSLDTINYLYKNKNIRVIGLIGHSKGAICAWNLAHYLIFNESYPWLRWIIGISGRTDMSQLSILLRDQVKELERVRGDGIQSDAPLAIPWGITCKVLNGGKEPETIQRKVYLTRSELDDFKEFQVVSVLRDLFDQSIKSGDQLVLISVHGDQDESVPISKGSISLPELNSNLHLKYVINGADHNYTRHSTELCSLIKDLVSRQQGMADMI
jgi:hypothetical protein